MSQDIVDRIRGCELENQRLRRRLALQNLLWLFLLCVTAAGSAMAARSTTQSSKSSVLDKIVAKEIVVVDDNGVVRARLGGDLPDAVCNGKTLPRGAKAAGLMIYDEQGIERGGYVTQYPGSNAMLTLDHKCRQSALFVAGPEEATALELWTKNDKIALRSDSAGSRLTVADKKGVVYQRPEINKLDEATCAIYKKLRPKHPTALRDRFTAQALDACIHQ
jgi:hypothetical protein